MHSNRTFGAAAPLLCLLLGLPALAQNTPGNVPPAPAANTPPPDRSHSQHDSAFDEGPRQQARKMQGLGNVHFPITTKSEEAQAFFDQGINLLYSFWYYEAERAFRQVAMLDPDCAMAYWGLAQTMEDKKAALKLALERKSHASDREQRYIAILEIVLRDGDPKARDAEVQRPLEQLILAYPEDNEAKIMMAQFLAPKTGDPENPLSRVAVEALLQQVLAKNPHHPAAHHFRIHLWDSQTDGKAGLESCRMYPLIVPNIGHAQHMPGHIYAQLGRWEDSVQALDAAARVERRYYYEQGRLPFHSWNYGHDMDYLVSGLGYLGRIQEGLVIAQELLASPCDPKYNAFDSGIVSIGRTSLLRMCIRGERWEDILHDTAFQWRDDAESQTWKHYALGMASLGSGNLAEARKQSDALDALIKDKEEKKAAQDKRDKEREEQMKREKEASAKGANDPGGKPSSATPPKDEKREDGPTDLMRCAQGELRGRLKVTQGDFAGGLEDLKKAEEIQRTKIAYNDPNPYPRPLYESLAWGYLQAKRFAEAETTLREGIKKEGDNGFALALLLEALQAQGKTDAILDARARMQAAWRHADADLPALRRALALASGPRLASAGGSNTLWSPTHAREGAKQRRYGPDHWQPFPAGEWTLRDADNRSVSLSAYRGKNLLLVFTLGGSCPHCNKQLQTLSEDKAAFDALGTEIVAASSDTPSTIHAFLAGEPGYPIRLLSDVNHSTARRYSALDEFENRELHVTILIDRKGREWWFRSGSEPFTDLAFLKQEIGRMNDWQAKETR